MGTITILILQVKELEDREMLSFQRVSLRAKI